jgi:hypothetical protein
MMLICHQLQDQPSSSPVCSNPYLQALTGFQAKYYFIRYLRAAVARLRFGSVYLERSSAVPLHSLKVDGRQSGRIRFEEAVTERAHCRISRQLKVVRGACNQSPEGKPETTSRPAAVRPSTPGAVHRCERLSFSAGRTSSD